MAAATNDEEAGEVTLASLELYHHKDGTPYMLGAGTFGMVCVVACVKPASGRCASDAWNWRHQTPHYLYAPLHGCGSPQPKSTLKQLLVIGWLQM